MRCGRRLTSPTSSASRSAASVAAQLRQTQPEQIHDGDLTDERLRRGDADLEARAGEQDPVGVAGGLRAHHVRDGQHAGAALARQPHRRERVGGLARLGDPEHEVAGADDGVAVAVLGGDVDLDGQPRPLFDRVAADQPGVVGGAAGDDHDPLDALEDRLVEARPSSCEVDPVATGRAVGDRVGDGVGLFVDLLQHERLVSALLGGLLVPVDGDRRRARRLARRRS